MGMFDWVDARDGDFTCPKGHVLRELQTKDFDCTMGTIVIEGGALTFHDTHGLGPPTTGEVNETLCIYEICDACKGGPLITFDVKVVANRVTSIERLPP